MAKILQNKPQTPRPRGHKVAWLLLLLSALILLIQTYNTSNTRPFSGFYNVQTTNGAWTKG